MDNDMVAIPFKIEADGTKTLFLPECRLLMGYEIGARHKDKQKGIQNYWDALDKLLAMSQPRFRRKNKKGIRGTVTCNFGDRELVSRSFIDSERVNFGG